MLGASAWPRYPELDASKAFLNSYRELRDYLLDSNGFDLPQDHLLDLFDSDDDANQLDEEISHFLKSHIAERKSGDVRDVLVYFIGHGEIAAGTSAFYLAIRRTRKENPKGSSIEIDNLARTLKELARHQRHFLILDCCFAASAVSYFQGSNLTSLMTEKTAEVFAKREKGDGFPSRGTTLLCSSRNTVRSRILPDETATMFTQALLHTLRIGTPYQKEKLSLYTVHRLTEDYLRQMYHDEAPRPEVHSPDQSEGDVAAIPFFPNFGATEKPVSPSVDTYRRAVAEAWVGKKLDEAKIEKLTRLASDISLAQEQIAAIEREVMGDTKEAICSRQVAREHQKRYRGEVKAAWASQLTREKVIFLSGLMSTLGLSQEEAATIERKVMGDVKEAIWARQVAYEQYLSEVEKAWANKKLNEESVAYLTGLVGSLDLDREEATTIERAVMGDTKEAIWRRYQISHMFGI